MLLYEADGDADTDRGAAFFSSVLAFLLLPEEK
jgi:hypothetical protein